MKKMINHQKQEPYLLELQGEELVNNCWMPIPKGDDDYPTEEFEEELKNSVPFMLYNHKWDSYVVAFDDISLGHTIDKLMWHHSEFDLWYKIPKVR